MDRRATVGIAVLLVLLGGYGGVGLASHDEPDVIHACVKDSKDGTTAKLKRFVSDPALCDPEKEQLLEWTEQGVGGQDLIHSAFTRTAIDAASNAGTHTAITLGRDGNPVVAYRDEAGLGLKIAACNDPACVGGDEMINYVETTSGAGKGASITIGEDGNPVASYARGSSFAVVHCNDRQTRKAAAKSSKTTNRSSVLTTRSSLRSSTASTSQSRLCHPPIPEVGSTPGGLV